MTYETIEIVEQSYAALFLSIKKHWENETRPLIVVDSQICSDRHTQKVYYIAVVREGMEPVKIETRKSWLGV